LRTERTFVKAGLRYRVVEQRRKRLGPKPLQRTRYAGQDPDPAPVLAPLDAEFRTMAERLLREGALGWRRWSTIRRGAGPSFSPYAVEVELLDDLCRRAGLTVVDAFRGGEWVPQRFRVDDRVRLWLGIEGPEVADQLREELTEPDLLELLDTGRPRGFSWRSFAFVMRACEHLRQLRRHGVRPGARELAGLIDHTKAWTSARMALVERLMGAPFQDLVAVGDRQLSLRGPVAHSEGGLWASRIEEVNLEVGATAKLLVLVENLETLKFLLHVPGGPPPAEVELIARLAALAPELPIHAAFDLDPAGLRIARRVVESTGLELRYDLMDPVLLEEAPHRLELGDWDRRELKNLSGRAGSLEPLRAALASAGEKVEQETLQRQLESRLRRCLEDDGDRMTQVSSDLNTTPTPQKP
jgi:hypothetical protein